jgi:hypothetical protein
MIASAVQRSAGLAVSDDQLGQGRRLNATVIPELPRR